MDVRASEVARFLEQEKADNGNKIMDHAVRVGPERFSFFR